MRTRLLKTPSSPQATTLGRRTLLTTGLLGLSGVLVACSADERKVAQDGGATAQQSGQIAVANPSSEAYQDLTNSLKQLEDEFDCQLTLSLYEYPTDEFPEGVQYDFQPEYQSHEASLAKVPIALSVLRQLAENQQEMSEEVRSQLEASLGKSDNVSTQALFQSLGDVSDQQAAYLNETYSRLGITSTHSEGDWGINLTNTKDQVLIARAVNDDVDWVNAEQLDIVRNIMVATDESQLWGVGAVSQEMGADYVLCKNGWIQDEDTGQWYINTMGIVNVHNRRYAISALNFGAMPDQQESGNSLATRAVNTALTYFNS